MTDRMNDEVILATRFAHVPVPKGAVNCDSWRWHGGRDWRRHFIVEEWNVASIWVSISGEQNHHGDVRHWLHVDGEDRCTTSDRKQLIQALVSAGLRLDGLAA